MLAYGNTLVILDDKDFMSLSYDNGTSTCSNTLDGSALTVWRNSSDIR